jgi:hypothetical protein
MKTETKPKDDTLPQAALVTLEDKRARLRAAFPDTAYGKLPKPTKKDNPKGHCKECGGWHGLPAVHLDYIGHATVTDRLLEVDPEWNWEPMAFDEGGLPRFIVTQDGSPIGLWIWLTVLGVRRPGFGSVESNAFEPEKQLIGDALRNAAMRFGVALDLWSKAELESAALAHEAKNGHAEAPKPAQAAKPRDLNQAADRAAQPAASRPASAQAATEPQKAPAVDGPDFNAMPEYHEDGSVTVFRAVKVSAAVIKRWAWWKKDLAIDSKRSPNTKLVALKDRPWSEVIEGPVDGGRERALIDGVIRTAEDIRAGKPVIQWSEKAAWALHMMYDERLKQEQAQVDRQDAEEPMPFDAAPAGQGHARGDWTKGDPESTPF